MFKIRNNDLVRETRKKVVSQLQSIKYPEMDIEGFFGPIYITSYLNRNKEFRFRRLIFILDVKSRDEIELIFGSDFVYSYDISFFREILNILKNFKITYSQKELNKLQKHASFSLPANFSLFQTYSSKCAKAEKTFYLLLEPESRYHRRGALVYHNGNLLGILKLKFNRTMLSLKLDENDVPLQKFTVYDIPKKWVEHIEHLDLPNDDWLRVNIKGEFKVSPYSKELREFNAILRLNEPTLRDKEYFTLKRSNIGFKRELILRLHDVYEKNKSVSYFDLEIDSEKVESMFY